MAGDPSARRCGGPLPRGNAARSRDQLREDLGRRSFSRLHCAVHVSVPDRGGLGTGPVQGADRGTQGTTEFGPAAGHHQAAVTTAGPLLLRPDALDEALGLRRLRAEETGVAGENGVATLGRRSPSPLARQPALEEAESTPGLPSGGELSKTMRAGPSSLAAWPERPSSRQK